MREERNKWRPSTELEWDMTEEKKGRESRNLCQGRYHIIPSYHYQGWLGFAYPRNQRDKCRDEERRQQKITDAPCNTQKWKKKDDNIMHVLAHTHTHTIACIHVRLAEWPAAGLNKSFSKSLFGCRELWFRVGSFSDTPAACVPCVESKPVIEHGLPPLQGTHTLTTF